MTDGSQCFLARRLALKVMFSSFTVMFTHSAPALTYESRKQEKEKMVINVIVDFEVKKQKVIDFINILMNIKTGLPKVEGCTGVDVFKSALVDNKFTLVETWQSKVFHQAHLNRLSDDGTWDMLASHLSKDPVSNYYIKI